MEFVKLNENEKEKLNLIESEKDTILDILNKIAILEFKTNYNLSEYKRIADVNKLENNEQYISLKDELKGMLDSILNGTEFDYRIMNFGTLSISHPINTNTFSNVPCSQEVLNYRHNINLPYAYVMGRGIGKKYAKEWLETANIE